MHGRGIKGAKISTRIFIIILFLAFVSRGAAAEAAERPTGGEPAARERVRIAAFPGTITALLYVAEEKKFFERHGLSVSVAVYDAGITALQDLSAGKIDVASVMEFPFAVGGVRIDDLRIVSSIAATNNLELIARKDRGIGRPADCRGKRIGVMKGTFAEFFLGVFLSFNGMRLSDVNVIDLKPSQMEEAVMRGSVDAVTVWQPFVYSIRRKMGNNAAVWSVQGTQDSYALLVTKESYIRTRPSVIEHLLRALLDAQDYTQRHTAEVQDIIKRRFGYERPILLALWPQNRLEVQLTQDLLTLMDDEARWAIQNRLFHVPKIPNFLNHIYLDALNKLNPDAVTIIH